MRREEEDRAHLESLEAETAESAAEAWWGTRADLRTEMIAVRNGRLSDVLLAGDDVESERTVLGGLRSERDELLQQISRMRAQRGFVGSTGDRVFRVQPVFIDENEDSDDETLVEQPAGLNPRLDEDPGALTERGRDLMRRFEAERAAGLTAENAGGVPPFSPPTPPPRRNELPHAHPSQQTLIQEHGYLAPMIHTSNPTTAIREQHTQPPTANGSTEMELLRQHILNMTHPSQRRPGQEVQPDLRETGDDRRGLPLLWRDDPVPSNPRVRTAGEGQILDRLTIIYTRFRQMEDTLRDNMDEMPRLLNDGLSSPNAEARYMQLLGEVSNLFRTLPHFLSFYNTPEDHEMWTRVREMFANFGRLHRRFESLRPPRSPGAPNTRDDDARRDALHAIYSPSTPQQQLTHASEDDGRRVYTPEELLRFPRSSSVIPSAPSVLGNRRERRGAISAGPPGTPHAASILNSIVENTAETPTLHERRQGFRLQVPA